MSEDLKKEEEQEPEVAPEPQPVPADIALLTEIRDLLKSQEKYMVINVK